MSFIFSSATDQKKDQKVDSKTSIIKMVGSDVVKKLLMAGKKGAGKLNKFKTKLCWGGTAASGSNAVLATVVNLDPSLSAEYSSFQALYDEVKVTGGVIHFTAWGAKSTFSTDNVYPLHGGVAYDPVDPTAYSSLVTLLVASNKFGPFSTMGVYANANNATSNSLAWLGGPLSQTKTGFHVFHFVCPPSQDRVPDSAGVVTGNWAQTYTSNPTPKWGFLKFLIDAAASTVSNMEYYVILDVEFRTRT